MAVNNRIVTDKLSEINDPKQSDFVDMFKKQAANIGTVLKILLKDLGDKIPNNNKNNDHNNKEYLNTNIVIVISIIFGCIFGFFAFLAKIGIIGFLNASDFFVLIILSAIGPYSFFEYSKVRRINKIEKHLPEFLRDLAENGKSGMPLHMAIRTAARGKYGELTKEIKKMSTQISWGASTQEVLIKFSERVKTPLVERSVALIIEASNSGGGVADVLTIASNDIRELQILKEKRKIEMSTYTSIIYISFFVFLSVVLVLTTTLMPKMADANRAVPTDGNLVSGVTVNTASTGILSELQFIFLCAAVVQGIGDGLAAGVICDGKFVTGLRHSFIMVLIGFVILRIM